MTDQLTVEGISPADETGKIELGNLVALDGAVYRILSKRDFCKLFVEAENIETFECVILTTAAMPTGFPIRSATKKENRLRSR
ncbi:MAG: hypothetical protein HZB51_26430 [Chloroflexi bacterium]|nr:hypothetical protein [Chloroflexota bacterium]